jgi:hypothetical protein
MYMYRLVGSYRKKDRMRNRGVKGKSGLVMKEEIRTWNNMKALYLSAVVQRN